MTQNTSIQKQLLNSASLLEVTRQHELAIKDPIHFTLTEQIEAALWDTGVFCVEPKSHGDKAIVISSGVHGNETAPIEIVDQIVSEIIKGHFSPKNRVLFIIGNPIAMNKGQRFDIENLNRLFLGKHSSKDHHEAKRAAKLESYVERFFANGTESQRYHYDLHTAIRGSKYPKFAIYPYTDGRPLDQGQLEFFLNSGINTILLGHQPAGTFSYYSSHTFQAHAFTVELGQVHPFGENDMNEFSDITKNLCALIKDEDIAVKPFNNNDFNLFQVKHELVKVSEENFKLNISDDVKNFTSFTEGYQLTDDSDGGYTTSTPDEAIVFPNTKVPVGQRAGLVVQKTQI